MPERESQAKAAFFRVEGTLVRPAPLPAPAYFTLNAQRVTPRLTRLGGAALATGLKLAGPFKDQQVVHRLAWMGLRGMSEDRLAVLGEEYYHRYVLPKLKPTGLELIEGARRSGHKVVLLSDDLDVVVGPLKDHLRADELLANVMETDHGKATGRLREPIIGATLSGQWARAFAADHGLDLGRSRAYGTYHQDGLLLSAIGQPCVVDPDWRLRRLAKDHDWPIVQS